MMPAAKNIAGMSLRMASDHNTEMHRMGTRGALRYAVVVLPLLACADANAQTQTCQPAEVRVLVKDSQEAPIYKAKVSIGSDTSEVATVLTPVSGVAEFASVPCGEWSAKATKEGFKDSGTRVEVLDRRGAFPVLEVTLTMEPQTNRSSLNVTASVPAPLEQSSSQNYELHPEEVKNLPANPATVSDVLPLVPGVVRAPNGELKIDGSGEQRSSLVVNESDVTDPATAKFGQTVPVDSIETVNVLNTPFLAQYGRFTQSVVAVETKRGGDKWHYDLNDPFPDFRIRSYHMVGISNETPHAVVGGPIIKDRLFIITAAQYYLDKTPNRTLGFPYNISKHERENSFTQIDYILSPRQIVNATLHYNPEHTNFVNPDYFNPQPVTPSYAQKAYEATVAHHLGLFGGTLDTSLSYQRFHTFIGAQGPAGEVIAPQGNEGNYFGTQTRDAFRREWLEIWSPAPIRFYGAHQIKVGTSLTVSSDHGEFTYRPLQVESAAGMLLESIGFQNQGPYKRTDLEFTGYAQDHWTLNSMLSIDTGLRVEHQRLAESLRIAPRAGLSLAPFKNQRTVFRTGYGQFYDHIPLDVYAFSRYPEQIVTTYAPDGSVIGAPVPYLNVIGSTNGPSSFLVHGQRVAGAFSPRGVTWNVQLEHTFPKLLHVRGVYTDNRSVGLIVLHPDTLGTQHEIVLDGSGSSRFREAEVTAKMAWQKGQQLVFTYVRSLAQGDQNAFDYYVGNFAAPFIRPSVYARLAGDLPNRFLMWGQVDLPFGFTLLPTVEYRDGFPYAVTDMFQNYVGVPNSTHFPDFFSLDARLMRDFKVSSKHTIRLSVTGYNLTDHFNALDVHSNIDDPQYGTFFGNYHRRFRFDFEIIQ
jgi:hypothetical protein